MFLTRFYCQDIRAYDILFGETPRPAQADELYEILDAFTEKYESEGRRANARRAARERRRPAVPCPRGRDGPSEAPPALELSLPVAPASLTPSVT